MKPSNTETQAVETAIASTEQAADLGALQAMAGTADGQEVEAASQTPSEPGAQAMQLAAMAVSIARPLLCYAVPALRTAPDALWEPIPQGVAGVLDHYDLGAQINNPWIGLALCCAPLAAFAAMESAKAKPEAISGPGKGLTAEPPTAPPASKTVTFGAPVEAAA